MSLKGRSHLPPTASRVCSTESPWPASSRKAMAPVTSSGATFLSDAASRRSASARAGSAAPAQCSTKAARAAASSCARVSSTFMSTPAMVRPTAALHRAERPRTRACAGREAPERARRAGIRWGGEWIGERGDGPARAAECTDLAMAAACNSSGGVLPSELLRTRPSTTPDRRPGTAPGVAVPRVSPARQPVSWRSRPSALPAAGMAESDCLPRVAHRNPHVPFPVSHPPDASHPGFPKRPREPQPLFSAHAA